MASTETGPEPGPAGAHPALTLRPFTVDDAEALFAWASDPHFTRFLRRDICRSIADARLYITDHILAQPWYRAVCIDARPVGSISVRPISGDAAGEQPFKANLGYGVGREHWGRGIATAAVKMAVSRVFSEWPWLERLEAMADVENAASQRVLEKAGFTREGTLRKYLRLKGETRDVVMFSFLRSDKP